MTILFILICIGIFILYSYDDLLRLNPISSKSEIVDSEPRVVNINNEKIWVPFRVVTYEEQFVDHRGMLHILPYFVEGKYKENYGMNLKYHLLKYKLCNETSLVNKSKNYKINVNLNELFCLEKDDIPFGGSWNGNFINYIEINLHLCKDGINFNSSDPRCSKMEDLLKETPWIFEIFYPVVQFQPTNLETPLAVIYRSYYYRLSTYTNKVERLFLQENILSDDRSIIINKQKNSSCWGTSTLYGDDYFLPNENNFISTGLSSRIYSLDIYMDDGCIYYTRTYKKIFLIISNIFPLFRFVLYFIDKFTQHIKMAFIKRNLAGLIFENKSISRSSIIRLNNLKNNFGKLKNEKLFSSKEFLKYKIINNNSFEKQNLNEINNKNKYKKIFIEKKDNDKISNNNSINKSNISLKNDKPIKIFNQKDILQINSKNKSVSLHESLKLKSSPKIKKKITISNKKFLFSYSYFLCDFFLDRFVNPQKFCLYPKEYFTVYNFMCRLYDISNYIILLNQFILINNALKKIHKKNDIYPSKPFKKINIKDKDIINKLNMDLNNKISVVFSNYLK